tara:strand:+ start:305 stop:412 length:108 start_codon:yes stop_codon:yes gene_type:complete
MHGVNEDNRNEPVEEVVFMHGENSDKENNDPRFHE